MTQPSPLEQEQSSKLSIVFDPDDAGRAAAIDAVILIHDLFDNWGEPPFPGDPDSEALASTQRAYSDLKALFHAQLSLGLETIQTEEDMLFTWEHIESLREQVSLGPSLYYKCNSIEEYDTRVALSQESRPKTGKIDYKGIKERIDLAEYIGQHTQLKHRAGKWTGKCPLPDHKDDTASFHIYPNQSWYCFGCRRGGDLFHYVKARGLKAEDIG